MSSHTKSHHNDLVTSLVQEQERLKKALGNLRRDDPFRDHDRTSDNAASDTDAYEENEHMRIEAQENELRLQLGLISDTLARIEQGTYGVCTSCGQPIDENRLRAIPTASVCISCEQQKT